METQYYNLIPPLAQSEDLGPVSPGSDDSGVQDEQPREPRPQRPPRSIDPLPPKLPAHSYINLVQGSTESYRNIRPKTKLFTDDLVLASTKQPPQTPPPSLPKRQPYLVQSPTLNHRNSVLQRSSSAASVQNQLFKKQNRRGICKCKVTASTAASDMNATKSTNEEDVLLVYSRHCPGAVEWAKYLHKLYTELSKHKGKLRVRHLPVEDLADCLLPPHMEKEITSSRLQLILLSPTLLQFLARNSNVVIGRLLHPDRVIAIMLGVRDSQITAQNRHSALVSFAQWIHLEAKDHDLEFVQTVLYFSTQILQRNSSSVNSGQAVTTSGDLTRNDSAANSGSGANKRFLKLARSSSSIANNCNRPPESTSFQVHPRRLTEDQNRVMIIFETPQSSRSKIKVTLERLEAELPDVDVDEIRLLNPYNMLITIPNCCFSVCNLAALRLEIDGANRGCRTVRVESSLSQIDHLLKMSHDPIDFMCQALGINPVCKDQLDEALTKQLVQNMPKTGFHLFNGPNSLVPESQPMPKDDGEFPTLLHFSACHGLTKLSIVLSDCSGSHDAIQMRNVSEMTPAELAHVNGHFDLANKLHSMHVNLYKESSKQHVYDYIQQNNYQIPPPPRPVHLKPNPIPNNVEVINHHEPTNNLITKSVPNNKDPYGTMRAEKKLATPPLVVDTKINTTLDNKEAFETDVDLDELGDDDVFVTGNGNADKFGTFKANKAINSNLQQENRMDYRETKGAKSENNGSGTNGNNQASEELAITDEFLKLLEDFQSKNYSTKEMEMLFENWKRKADLQDIKDSDDKSDSSSTKDKTTKQKATNLILKFFKSSNAIMHSQSDPIIKTTKDTKTYRKPSKTEELQTIIKPIISNESIDEGEITIINADDSCFDIVTLPDTPQKPKESPKEFQNEGISTQILPLSRLSLSSNSASNSVYSGSPPNTTNNESAKNENGNGNGRARLDACVEATPTGRPVAEVQPFSNSDQNDNDLTIFSPTRQSTAELSTVTTRVKTSPVRDKLDKIRRSLTEPLIQYFHDLQSSTDSDEPEILNTPKSIAPPAHNLSVTLPKDQSKSNGIKAKTLNFQEDYQSGPIRKPPPMVTDM